MNIRTSQKGQALVEGLLSLAAILLFVLATQAICATSVKEMTRHRLTRKESYGSQMARHRFGKEAPARYPRDSDPVFLMRELAR